MAPRLQRERIVIFRRGSMGDTVVALPCFHHIARKFPDAERIVLTNYPVSSKAPRLLDILGSSGLVHGALEYPLGLRSPGKLLSLRTELRRLGADILIYMAVPGSAAAGIRDLMFFRACGFSTIIGAPIKSSFRLNAIDPTTGEQEPEYKRLARALGELGLIDTNDPKSWDLLLSDIEKDDATRLLKPLASRRVIAINMGGKVIEKDWGAVNWANFIAALGDKYSDFGLVIVGAPDDMARGSAIAAHWPGRFLDFCGRLSPRQSAAVLANAAVFIGHDSGPLHLAAAAGVACIGIFGNLNKPRKWHPWGKHHRILHDVDGINNITINQVLDALNKLVSGFSALKNENSRHQIIKFHEPI